MHHFTIHQLHFTCEVQTPILLNEHQGSAIRGALFNALRRHFCFEKQLKDCGDCPLWATCPICFLVATRNPQSERGVEVPRPYTIEPPLGGKIRYEPGETLKFGLTMFAQALNLFPYVVLGSRALEQGGLGKRLQREDGRWRRGTFLVREIAAVNPLTGERQPVLRRGDTMVQVPDIPITHQQITDHVSRLTPHASRFTPHVSRFTPHASRFTLHASRFTLHFLTPTRITEEKHLLKPASFHFRPFFQRLLERLEALSRDFSDTPQQFDFPALLAAAEKVQVVQNHLYWVELRSFSTRQQRSTPTSGFAGEVTLECADWSPFLPWLAWGQFTHVGKDAVKGDGWYEMRIANCE